MPIRTILSGATREGMLVAAYLALALVMGGGGSPSPVAELTVQIGFALMVAAWFVGKERGAVGRVDVSMPLMLLAGTILTLPVLQLVPMPPALWHALPGREIEVRALEVIGQSESWRPLSVAPYRTFASLLAMTPAVGLMLAVSRLDLRERRMLIGVVALVALLSVPLGALQLASGETGNFQLYAQSHHGWLTGFFANRNAAVDGLLAGSLALTCLYLNRAASAPAPSGAQAIFVVSQCALLVAAVLTGSRAGIALIAVVLAVSFIMMRGTTFGRRLGPVTIGMALLAGALLVLPAVVGGTGRFAAVVGRFDATGDVRSEIWSDTIAALGHFWPAGSGIGTFAVAFPPFERLEVVDEFYTNRAHNDFLEFALEAGVLAPLVLVLAAMVIVPLARKALKAGGETRLHALFALGILTVITLHSIVDYPLRTVALASLAGMAAGLFSHPRQNANRVEMTGIKS